MKKPHQTVSQHAHGREAPWISSMREHYSMTGKYRQEDVYRLLGEPWDRAEIKISSGGLYASRASDKDK